MAITERIDAITRIQFFTDNPPAPKSVKIELTGRCNYRCLRGDTLVNTLYGKIPIKELADRWGSIPVYTYREGEVFISDAINIRKTGEDAELIRVNFDDGTHIDCTPDHHFLQFQTRGAKSGVTEWPTEAQNLVPGSRVRAIREGLGGVGYAYINAGRAFSKRKSRLIMEYALGRKLTRTEQVHHIDRNITNDTPENLEYVASAREHAQCHPEVAERMRDNNPARNMTVKWREKISRSLRGKVRTLEQRIRYRTSKLGDKNPNYRDGNWSGIKSRIAEVNHRVLSVENLPEREAVYCMEVPASGWFFAGDVLVKNCSFCALRTREVQPKGDMNFDLFKRITREMREEGVEEIGLFYLGESFINPGLLVDACHYLKHDLQMPYVFLTSNASLATPTNVFDVMKAGLDSLKWSVNASDEVQFKEIMGVKASLMRNAKENIRLAWDVRKEGGFKTGLYASSIMYDGEQQAKMEEMLARDVIPYVDRHYWLPLYGQMTHWNEERSNSLGYTPTAGNQGRIGALRDPLPCWSAFTEGHVTADGKLSACCFDSDGRFAMGDLNNDSFIEAWNSEGFKRLRRAHLRKNVEGTICEGCLAYG